jgi:hypothetical protein
LKPLNELISIGTSSKADKNYLFEFNKHISFHHGRQEMLLSMGLGEI